MSRLAFLVTLIGASSLGSAAVPTQSPGGAQFDVVSIKPSAAGGNGGGMRTLPDGSFVMTNQPIRSIIQAASPVPVRDVAGFPDWVNTDRYDVTAKAPAGASREQQGEMMRNMFVERMKLIGHVEQQERNTFALVLARSDGRLGPQLTPSTLDCSPRAPSGPPAAPPAPATHEGVAACSWDAGRSNLAASPWTPSSARSVVSLAGS